uniref:Uncharacterized protein n=1 Tax=Moniliophthora roreri TaxID=221103 RepID=A0A0W0F8D6_MONRR
MTERPSINEEDYLDDDNGELIKFQMGDGVLEELYPFENFKDEIDNCGGYLFELAKCIEDFEDKLHEAWLEAKVDEEVRYSLLDLLKNGVMTILTRRNIGATLLRI